LELCQPLVSAKLAGVYVSFTRVNTTDQPIEIGLPFWESRDVAERHRVARMQFLNRMASVADVEIEETTDFEVAFADLGARLTSFSA
jgi:hypothetical protein